MARSTNTAKKPKPQALMKEPGGLRGLVPTMEYGELDAPYNSYLDRLDPKNNLELQQALAGNSDPRFRVFLDRLSKHPFNKWCLAKIAKSCDISLPQFADFYQKAQTQRALAVAQESLPIVTAGIVADALSTEVSCDRCDGYGWVYSEDGLPGSYKLDPKDAKSRTIRACPTCSGKKTQVRSGSTDARKIVLEMTGLVNKRTPAVVLNQNFGGMSMESAVDRLSKVSFNLDDAPIDITATATESSEPELLKEEQVNAH